MLKKLGITLIGLLFFCKIISAIDIPDNAKALATGQVSYLENQSSIFINPASISNITIPRINLCVISYGNNIYGTLNTSIKLSDASALALGACILDSSVFGVSYAQKADILSLGINAKYYSCQKKVLLL